MLKTVLSVLYYVMDDSECQTVNGEKDASAKGKMSLFLSTDVMLIATNYIGCFLKQQSYWVKIIFNFPIRLRKEFYVILACVALMSSNEGLE